MSQTLDSRALNMLVARLVEEENRRATHIMTGAATDFCDYRYRVGFVEGLRFAAKTCEDVERDLYGGGIAKKA